MDRRLTMRKVAEAVIEGTLNTTTESEQADKAGNADKPEQTSE
jgi:hypothetical protein